MHSWIRMTFAALVAALVAVLAIGGTAAAATKDHVAPIMALVESEIRAIVTAPDVIAAIKAQNAANASLDQAAIDGLDA
ncbi:MAG: hypothetical protein EXQ94_02820 [Alphaproteobacteria bacterium]|nr:hypothetical protein [Alphaproteobacteria bacterium]